MRVFAPRRFLRVGNRQSTEGFPLRAYGIPFEGDWRDVPDYFVQITTGRPVNDVTHAKLVDPVELPYRVFNGKLKSRNEYVVQSHFRRTGREPSAGVDVDLCYADWSTTKEMAILEPSPNYKGKNPQRVQKEIKVNHLHPFFLNVGLSMRPRLGWWNSPTYYLMVPTGGAPNYRGQIPVAYHVISMTRDNITGDQMFASHQRNVEFYNKLGIIGVVDKGPVVNEISFQVAEELAKPAVKRLVRWVGDHYDALRDGTNASHGILYCDAYDFEAEDFPAYEPRKAYVLNEDVVFAEHLDPMLLGSAGGFNTYWRNYLTEHALLAACESLPRLSDNSIQNLCEIAGFVKALVVDHKIEIPESLADMWLSYRYQIGTTAMDAQDAIKFVHRHMDLGTLDREIVGRGTAVHTVSGTEVVCRCEVKVKPKNVGYLQRIWRALDTYGLTPDFYVIWDSIPYSFMVDWFLPIGDLAGVWDANSVYFSGELYDLYDLCWSLSYIREVDGMNISCYTRWAGEVPPSLHSRYWLEPPSASSKTVGYRILDAASIFL